MSATHIAPEAPLVGALVSKVTIVTEASRNA